VGQGGYPWLSEVLREIRPGAGSPVPSPVATATGLSELLTLCGYVEPTTRRVEERFVFPSVEAFVAWGWSHGWRRLLESFSDEELAKFQEASAERLEAHAVSGGYELIQAAEVTVAASPAS
jgi:hypothetical protein